MFLNDSARNAENNRVVAGDGSAMGTVVAMDLVPTAKIPAGRLTVEVERDE